MPAVYLQFLTHTSDTQYYLKRPYVVHNTSLSQLLVHVKAWGSSLRHGAAAAGRGGIGVRNWDGITAVRGQPQGRLFDSTKALYLLFLAHNHATLLQTLCRPCIHSDTTYNTLYNIDNRTWQY